MSASNSSCKRKLSQDVDIEDVLDEEVQQNLNSRKNRDTIGVRKWQQSFSFKEWTKSDLDLAAITPRRRFSLHEESHHTDQDIGVISWSSSDEEAESSEDLGRCISTQKARSQRSICFSSISSFGSEPDSIEVICKDSQESEVNISPSSSPVVEAAAFCGTTWLQGILWHPKTPEKTNDCAEVDLGSGRKKCFKGGFADQLQKLEARRKSSRTIWRHERDNFGHTSKLVLTVKSIIDDQSLAKVSCDVVTSGFSSRVLLLLNATNALLGNISDGSTLNVFPPWQTLTIPGNDFPVIVSPLFVELADKQQSEEDSRVITNGDPIVVFQWECPCRNGVCPVEMCPLYFREMDSPLDSGVFTGY